MSNRKEKTYSIPKAQELANKFTINLGGIKLDEGQLDTIRNHAIRNALAAAAEILKGKGAEGGLNDFSTFSTFSTFSSGAAELPLETQEIIDRAVSGKSRSK